VEELVDQVQFRGRGIHDRELQPVALGRAAEGRARFGATFMTLGPSCLNLPEPLCSVLAAWAEAEGRPLGGLIEFLLTKAASERRARARAEVEAARRALADAAAMLTKLLQKGPGAVLAPEDFDEDEPGRAAAARLSEASPRGDGVIDLEGVRAALNEAAEGYQRAARVLTSVEGPNAATVGSRPAPQQPFVSRSGPENVPEPQFRALRAGDDYPREPELLRSEDLSPRRELAITPGERLARTPTVRRLLSSRYSSSDSEPGGSMPRAAR
jgi:hypothetical protein